MNHWFPLTRPYETLISEGGTLRGGRLTSHDKTVILPEARQRRDRGLGTLPRTIGNSTIKTGEFGVDSSNDTIGTFCYGCRKNIPGNSHFEPKNQLIAKEKHLPSSSTFGFHVNFPGRMYIYIYI